MQTLLVIELLIYLILPSSVLRNMKARTGQLVVHVTWQRVIKLCCSYPNHRAMFSESHPKLQRSIKSTFTLKIRDKGNHHLKAAKNWEIHKIINTLPRLHGRRSRTRRWDRHEVRYCLGYTWYWMTLCSGQKHRPIGTRQFRTPFAEKYCLHEIGRN